MTSATMPRSRPIGARRCGSRAGRMPRARCGRRRWRAIRIPNRCRRSSPASFRMPNDTRVLPAGAWVAGLALVLTLAACQTVPVAPAPSVAWNVRRPALQSLPRFGLNGRVAVAVGKQGFNAGLRWTQSAAVTRLALTGPLGAGGVDVTADGGNLSVVTSSGKRLGNADARTELEDKLGFAPPLASLRYWILGVPDT